MPPFSVFLVVLGIPLIVVLGNGWVRWLFKSPQSAAADLILAMVVFDAAVSLQAHDFQPFVKTLMFKENLAPIYMSLLLINIFIWMGTAFKLEPNLLSEFDFNQRQYKRSPRKLILYSYLVSVFVLLTNTLIFTYGNS